MFLNMNHFQVIFPIHLPLKYGDDDTSVHVSIRSFCDVSSVGCAKQCKNVKIIFFFIK